MHESISTNGDVLTFDQMKAQFASQWVLIGEPQTDESLEVLSGKVLCHSTSREDVDRVLLDLRPQRFALRYFGTLPENMALVL